MTKETTYFFKTPTIFDTSPTRIQVSEVNIITYRNCRNRSRCSANLCLRSRNRTSTRTGNSLWSTAVRDNGAPRYGDAADSGDGPSYRAANLRFRELYAGGHTYLSHCPYV